MSVPDRRRLPLGSFWLAGGEKPNAGGPRLTGPASQAWAPKPGLQSVFAAGAGAKQENWPATDEAGTGKDAGHTTPGLTVQSSGEGTKR